MFVGRFAQFLMAEAEGRGGTPRQPKSVNFQTKGLSTICHFLAPWESVFLRVKWPGWVVAPALLRGDMAKGSPQPFFKG